MPLDPMLSTHLANINDKKLNCQEFALFRSISTPKNQTSYLQKLFLVSQNDKILSKQRKQLFLEEAFSQIKLTKCIVDLFKLLIW